MIMIVIALIIGSGFLFMVTKMYGNDHSDHKGHDHNDKETGKKDGCMCECEFTSNQNETSCNNHGGCKWTGNKCITE